MDKKLEDKISELIALCNEQGVAISGALESTHNTLIGFSNHQPAKSDEYQNIHSLVKAKGDIDELMLTSEPFFINEDDERATCFTKTNPHVFVTLH